MKENLISIVTPVYNKEKYLGEMIACVQKQTWGNWELILVDDCSEDRSLGVIENYLEDSRIRLIRLEENHGAAFARNAGVKEAAGRYLCFLDADDLWAEEKLERQKAFMEQNGCGFGFTSYEFADARGRGLGKIAHVPEYLEYEGALRNTIIFTSTVMFDRRQIPDKLLYMPEVESEDTATWWQILRAGYTAHGLDEVLSFYRRSAGTLSSNKWTAVKRIWMLYTREGLPFIKKCSCFCCFAWNAVRRRI